MTEEGGDRGERRARSHTRLKATADKTNVICNVNKNSYVSIKKITLREATKNDYVSMKKITMHEATNDGGARAAGAGSSFVRSRAACGRRTRTRRAPRRRRAPTA